MYRLMHSLRLLVLLLTLSLGVGGQLFGQYYPVHVMTVQWPSSQSPENLLSATSSSEGRVGRKHGLKVERVDKIGSFDASRLAHDVGTVRFEPSAQGRYAFDDGTEPWYERSVKLDEYYKPFAKGYIAPWKLIPTGEQDVVTARYEGKKAIDLSRVRFATSPNSPALPAELHQESKTWSLKLPATDAQSSYDVYAIYEGEVLGKLRVVSYPKQRHKLTLVPVNDAQLDKAQIERELNSIYNSVGVHFDVEVDARMRGNYSWDRDGDGKLSVVGKSFFGRVREVKESAEMEYLKKAYTQLAGTLDGVYLFITEGAQGLDDKPQSLLGEMPRRSRFGYIFSGNSPNEGASALSHTIAHELGHGLFTLQHTFDDEYGGTKSQGQTRNLMDYATGKELAAFQWNVLANPAVFTAADNKSQGDLVSRQEARIDAKNGGITPAGKVILSVKATDSDHIATLTIVPGSYYVHGITLFSRDGTPTKSYSWDEEKKTYVSGGASIEDAPELELTYNTRSQQVTARLYRVASGDECFYQYHDVTYDPANPSSLKIPEQDWKTDYLWSASESCKAELIARTTLAKDRRSYDEEQIKRDILKLGQLSEKTSYEDLLRTLESCHIRSLKRQSYEWLIRTFNRIAQKEMLKEREELAILRLMQSMDGKDYSRFYRDLEADQNALLRHLVSEIDDVSLYFWTDKENYTNFIGALVWMFNADGGKSIKGRFPEAPDDYARIVLNLTPVKYGSVQLMGGGDASFTEKYNQGEYISSTGEVKLLDVYKTYTTTRNSLHSQEHREELGVVSPLTPIIIVPDTDHLPLIETALGGNALSDQMYVVPAIFMKYRADKIRNDHIAKGVFTAFDVATIVFSGGTALATKVHWVQRAWALAEVVGAVGNIAVNAQVITDPKLKLAVDIYNTAMGVIGIKNAGQAGYKFVKNLPEETKKLLQRNGELRKMLSQRYQVWKTQRAKLGENLNLVEQQVVDQQEKAWSILRLATKEVTLVGKYSLANINKELGFVDILPRLLEKERLTMEDFIKATQSIRKELPYAPRAKIARLRNAISSPTAETVMQKVIPASELDEYISGLYNNIQGFITKAADTKHLNSFDDLYYGLRLDYDGTKFFLDEGYCYVLRFKSKEVPLKVNVPRGRDFKDSYPFTSHGFTAGIRGRIGVPEFIIRSGFRVPIEGGTEIWKITRDGKQTLYAVFEEGKFIVLK